MKKRMVLALLIFMPCLATAEPAPVISFSAYLGGSRFDSATSIASDREGNIYVAGWTESSEWVPARATRLAPQISGLDAFAVKFNPAGELVYCTILGGSGADRALGIAVDAAGNAYIAGSTASSDFPVVGGVSSRLAGRTDAFVSKLDRNGAVLLYSTYLGGSGSDIANSIAVSGDTVFVGGETDSPDFPRVAAAQANLGGATDGFITKLNAGGNSIVFSTLVGGYANDRVTAVAAGTDGAVYAAGSTMSPNFPTARALQGSLRGVQDAFVTKLLPGGAWDYSTYLGGSGGTAPVYEGANTIAVDAAGNAYVAGTTNSTDFPVAGAYQAQLKGGADGFVSKISPGGTSLVFSTYIGGSGIDAVSAIAVNAAGIHVGGHTYSRDFPWVNGVQSSFAGATDSFAATLAPDGASLRVSTYLGGSNSDAAAAITTVNGSVYIAGMTQSADFPLSSGEIGAAGLNAFITRVVNASAPKAPVRGDFDSNGTPDILWQKDSTGETTVSYLGGPDGTMNVGSGWISGPMGIWRVAGIADFNRDGHPDVVWLNQSTRQVTVNFFGGASGSVLQGWAWLNAGGIPGWSVVAVADFNSDEKPDLVWQNDTTRQLTVNYYSGPEGTTLQGWAWLNANGIPGWGVVASGDFNSDGKPDILWQNDSTREVTVNYFGGALGNVFLGWNYVMRDGMARRSVVGVGDYNQDGKPDVVWQDGATRQLGVNYYGGTQGNTLLGWSWLDSTGQLGWRAVAPR